MRESRPFHRVLHQVHSTVKQIGIDLTTVVHVDLQSCGPHCSDTPADQVVKTAVKKCDRYAGIAERFHNPIRAFDEVTIDRSNLDLRLQVHRLRLWRTLWIEKP